MLRAPLWRRTDRADRMRVCSNSACVLAKALAEWGQRLETGARAYPKAYLLTCADGAALASFLLPWFVLHVRAGPHGSAHGPESGGCADQARGSSLPPKSDSSQFHSTCPRLPLVLGCSNLAC